MASGPGRNPNRSRQAEALAAGIQAAGIQAGGNAPPTPTPPLKAKSPNIIEAEDVLKAALTQVSEQAQRNDVKALASISIRPFDKSDALKANATREVGTQCPEVRRVERFIPNRQRLVGRTGIQGRY